MKPVFTMLLVLSGLIAVTADAETIPIRGTADSRVRTAVYNRDQVYRLRGYVGYEIDLQFEPGEAFVGLGAGDLEGLSFQAQDNHLFIKPKVAVVGTNMTVLTSKRPYQLDYTASGSHPRASDFDVVYALRFTYAPAPGAAANDGLGRLLDQAAAARVHNTDYWYCGSPTLKPLLVEDDGVHTRLRFDPKSEQPAVFISNDDGSESLLNYGVQAGDVMVYRIARELIVRRGRLVGRIVNKGFVGIGERLGSGTISPQVERSTTGIEP